MGTRLFVGNMPYNASAEDIRGVFAQFGAVKDCHLVMDRDTGKAKGYGFVEMTTQEEADKAMKASAVEVGGRRLSVSEARPRVPGAYPAKSSFKPKPIDDMPF